VLFQKFDEEVDHALAFIPEEAGIQMLLKFLDSGSPGLPGMTIE